MSSNKKLLQKYKDKLSFIFNDKFLSQSIKNHFDKNGTCILFVIALLQNKLGEKVINNHLYINKDEWIDLFSSLYRDENVIKVYKKLEINPIIPLNQIIDSFKCFNRYVDTLITFLKQHELNLNISENDLRCLFKNVFNYVTYNCIDCKLPYDLKDILHDPDYDTKYLMILNNTKLFAAAKQSIISCCKDKINDLIVLLLGTNKSLSEED